MIDEKRIVLFCGCGYHDHQVIVSHWPDDNCLYVTAHLTPLRPWWRRVATAVRYVFGRTCKYGDWAEVIIDDPRDAVKLGNLLDDYVADNQAQRDAVAKVREQMEGRDG